MCLASSAIETAQNRQATSANTTDSGREPPARAAPAGIDAAIAAPGAMSVMLWKRTSRSPIASRRRAGVAGMIWSVMTDLAPSDHGSIDQKVRASMHFGKSLYGGLGA